MFSFFDGIDLIVPVPLHQRKKRLRGYNQSECLVRGVSVVTGIPMNTKVVIRSRYTDTQTHKGQYARWENVRNLFACIFPDGLEGKHLLLVDDVLTTGATVVSCADAFRWHTRITYQCTYFGIGRGILITTTIF